MRQAQLTVAEERRLSQRWRRGADRAALGRMVQAHLGLVIRIASEFRHSGPAFEDLVQEGNVGLTIAARRFDPGRDTRLATYATYWIRACMLEHVVRSHGPVRIGTTRSQRKIFFNLGRARRRLECTGIDVSAEELAGVLGVAREEVEHLVPRLSPHDLALDAPAAGASLATDLPTPEDCFAGLEESSTRRVQLSAALKTLDAREQVIIRARHLRQRPLTLAALGRRFGISRERVRQLENRAKEKLTRFCEPSPSLPA